MAAEDGNDPVLAKIMGDLRKAKSGVFSSFADGIKLSEPKYRLSTGVILLDHAIGGGLPVGRVVEIHGKESTGKSLIGLNFLGNALKLGWFAAILETERAPTEDFSTRMGHVDPSQIIQLQRPKDPKRKDALLPWTLEAAMDAISELVDTVREHAPVNEGGKPLVVLWDSYAGLCCASELLLRMDQRDAMGKRAYMLKVWFTKEIQRFADQDVLLIVTNHVTANIGNQYEPETTPGGSAIRMFTSVRLKFRKAEPVKDEDKDPIGEWVRWTIIKNRMDPPGRWAKFPIYYADGIHDHEALFDYVNERGKFGSSKGWITWKEKKYREDAFLDLMLADPVVRQQVADTAVQLWDKKEDVPNPETEGVPLSGSTDPETGTVS